MDLLNFFLIFKLCILLENKEKQFGVRGTLTDLIVLTDSSTLKLHLVAKNIKARYTNSKISGRQLGD